MRTSIREPLVRFIVKHPFFTVAMLGAAAAIGGAVVAVSGVVPIKASSGHWEITSRLLDFAKVQSARTYSLGIEPPVLDDVLATRGAAHYAFGCAPCHGAPDMSVPPVMAAMTPPPPALTGDMIRRWSDAQLFTIVKHGIKFTGMPAWPAQQRDDEVWTIVAFLRRMPDLDPRGYRRLADGGSGSPSGGTEASSTSGIPAPDRVRDLCSRCHAADGRGRTEGALPALAGQRAAYLYGSLRAFADRTRYSATMAEVAARLDDAAMRAIATYYEQLPGAAPPGPVDRASVARGAAIAAKGIPERDVPACVECHGPTDVSKNPAYPRLAGQHARYLRLQLELLGQRRRGGSAHVDVMHKVADRLQPSDIQDVVRYYASLASAPGETPAPPP